MNFAEVFAGMQAKGEYGTGPRGGAAGWFVDLSEVVTNEEVTQRISERTRISNIVMLGGYAMAYAAAEADPSLVPDRISEVLTFKRGSLPRPSDLFTLITAGVQISQHIDNGRLRYFKHAGAEHGRVLWYIQTALKKL